MSVTSFCPIVKDEMHFQAVCPLDPPLQGQAWIQNKAKEPMHRSFTGSSKWLVIQSNIMLSTDTGGKPGSGCELKSTLLNCKMSLCGILIFCWTDDKSKCLEKNKPSKFLKIILIFILIRSQIILTLEAINICPTVKFIAHAVTLLPQHSVSLPLSLSLSLHCFALWLPFSIEYKKCIVCRTGYHWINEFHWMWFSFERLAYTKLNIWILSSKKCQ